MGFAEKKSRGELSRFIESYWHFDGQLDDLVLFPDGTFNILFAFEPFCLLNTKRTLKAGVYLVPISSVPISIRSNSKLYGIRFKAFSLVNIVGKNPSKLTLLNDLKSFAERSPALLELINNLDREQSIDEVTSELEKVAYELLYKQLNINLNLRDKVNYILDNKGLVRVDDMAKEFGVSRQALHKNFTKNLLITPKELAAIWQLNHFFTLANRSEDNLTGLALDAGYYDQAHFINSFKMKFGVSPTQFIKSHGEVFTFAQESMAKRFNNYYDPED